MSKYSADIEIAVRGGQQLNNTIKSLNRLNNSINLINRNAKLLEGKGFNVASIENYSRAVSKAERAVRKAAEGTNQERQAITQLVSAMELENKARERKNILIAREVANQRRAVATANAGVGIQGPALPAYMMSGPRSPIGGGPRGRDAGRGGGGGSRLGGAVSGSIIGGSFPLLFGQGAGAAAGGAIGGLLGGLAGPGGSFAGSLLGTLLGDIASQGSKVKDLADDIGFSAEQTERLKNAFALAGQEADKFEAATQNIRGLGLSIDDQADAITLAANLTEAYGGKIDKVAAAYANFVEKGKVGIADINKFTSEGIPILDELEKKYNTNRDGILKLAKDGKISAQALSDALIAVGNSSDTAVKKTVSGWDKAWADIKAGGSLWGQAISSYFNALVGSAGSSTASIAESFGSMFKNIVQYSIDATAALVRNLANLARFGANVSATAELGGLNIGATASKNILKNIETTARNFDANLQKIKLPTPGKVGAITVPGQAPATGGGGAGRKSKSNDDAERERKRVADLVRDQQFIANQLGIQAKFAQLIADAELSGDPVRVRQLQTAEELVLAGNETARLLEEEVNRTAQLEIARARMAKAELTRVKSALDVAKIQDEQQKNFDVIIADLQLEYDLKFATTEQVREQLRLEAEIAKIRRDKGLTPEQQEEIIKRKSELAKPKTESQKIDDRIGKLKDELTELTSLSNQVTSAANAIGTAFGDSFKGLVSGTMTAQQALASFFSSVADYFMDMAAQIIAKMIEMFVIKQLLGIFGGALGGGGGFTPLDNTAATSFGFNPGAMTGGLTPGGLFAEGGFVTGPTNAIIGEGGEAEYVIPASKMSAAMQRYGSGARGSAVIPTSGGSSTEPASTGAAPGGAIDVRYTVERINSVDYVTADQFQQGMQQAAIQGAQRGEQMVLRKLQQSPSTRRRVGVG